MNRRFVAASIVALTVLFSQGGGLVWAAVCPHLRSQKPEHGCHTNSPVRVAEPHHQAAASGGDAVETIERDVRCNHCALHSRTRREEPVLQQPAPQRTSDLKVITNFLPSGVPGLETVVAVANAHGPPGATAPVYLLLNVFRI